MKSAPSLALVTGASRGIGFGIARKLAETGFKVILTARNEKAGRKAAEELASKNLDIVYHQLDVTDEKSIEALAAFVKKQFGVLDVLINNAGILNSKDSSRVTLHELKEVFDTNFFGAFAVTQAMLPFLKKSLDARIINLSSGMGAFNEIGSSHFAYRTSKTAFNGLTAVMAADLAGTNIKINSMCPGWVRSDMGGKSAPRSIEQGADTAVWLATEKNIPSGKFFRDRRPINW